MGAYFVSKTSKSSQAVKLTTIALAAVFCASLPGLANSSDVCQDKLAMNTGTSTTATTNYQDAEIKHAVDVLKAVEKQAEVNLKAKKVLRHNQRSAGNILILGGAEAFPM